MSKIVFTDTTGKKKVRIGTKNTQDVKLLLKPTNFVTEEGLRRLLKDYTELPNTILSCTITSPVDGEQDFHSSFTATCDIGTITSIASYSTLFEISNTRSFDNPIYRKVVRGGKKLPITDITTINFNSEKKLYVRAKVIGLGPDDTTAYATPWSGVVSFNARSSSYRTSNAKIRMNDTNGVVTFIADPYAVESGMPPTPNKLEVTISEARPALRSALGIKLVYDVDSSGEVVVNTENNYIGRVLVPGKSYRFRMRYKYETEGMELYSPELTISEIAIGNDIVKSNTAYIKKVDITVDDFGLISNGLAMATSPSFYINGIRTTYDIISAMVPNLIPVGEADIHLASNNGGLQVLLSCYEGENPDVNTQEDLIDFYKEFPFRSIVYGFDGDLTITSGKMLKLSTKYTLVLKIILSKKDLYRFEGEHNHFGQTPANFANVLVKKKTFITPSTYIPVNNKLNSVPKVYNGFGYFGEVQADIFLKTPKYVGTFDPLREYEPGLEVKFNSKLYTSNPRMRPLTEPCDDPSVNEHWFESAGEIASSRYPIEDLEEAMKRIGIPTDVDIHVDRNCEIVKGDNVSPLKLTMQPWIKAFNRCNQIVLISRTPVVKEMDPIVLKRRMLLSSSRTIRYKDRLYRVRLLQNDSSGITDSIFKTAKKQSEFELFQFLFTNLMSYEPRELELLDMGKILVNNGLIEYRRKNIGIECTSREWNINHEVKGTYIPVFEEVADGYAPYEKALPFTKSLPLQYDFGTDTGYYGSLLAQSLATPTELKMLYKMKNLRIESDDIFYYRYYWHGLIVHIPNKPFGKIKIKDLKSYNMIYGLENVNKLNSNGVEMKMMNMSASRSLYTKIDVLNNGLEDNTILMDLLLRSTTYYDGGLNKQLVNPADKFPVNGMDLSGYSIFLSDVVLESQEGKHYLVLRDKRFVAVTEEEVVDFMPVIVTDCDDYKQDYTLPSYNYKQVNYREVPMTITMPVVVEKKVKKQKEVKISKEVVKYRDEMVSVETPTGEFTIPEVSKDSHLEYGMILFYCKSSDMANLKEPLYSKSMLNIKKSNRENTVFYSENIRSIPEYLAKTLRVSKQDGFCGKPYHTNYFYRTLQEGMDGISQYTNMPMMKITNTNPEVPRNSGDYTSSMVAGIIASNEIAFQYNSNYSLSNPELDVSTPIDTTVNIEVKGDVVKSSVTRILDNSGVIVEVPILNPYIEYNALTPAGKRIADNFYLYLKASDETLPPKEELCFGFVVAHLPTLKYKKGGILGGTDFTPTIQAFTNRDVLLSYFGDSLDNRSRGDDYLDIGNKKPIVTTTETVMQVPYVEIVESTEMVEYDEITYVTEMQEVKVMVNKPIEELVQ